MPTRIGQYEILSELAKSPTGTVYKANDGDSGQTVALKSIQLSAFGEHAAELEQALQKEVENVKVLTSPNLTRVFNPAVIEGQFCAAMEYVQGNSIATMLARNEGFSIWDLLDIGRQLCAGLDHASSHQIVHYSLEPSKIMCGWDGTVKILSFGVSGVGNFVQHASEGVSSILNYMSPEQIRGEATDARSNLFSLGAIFYEMVTEQKAFDGADLESLRASLLEGTPVPPVQLNAKVHPLLSDLIMRVLAKDPGQRYQTGRQLLDDLENCKEVRPAAKTAPVPRPTSPVSNHLKTTAQPKFVAPKANPQPTPASGSSLAARTPAPPKNATPVRPAAPKPGLGQPASRQATPKAAAAAAGAGTSAFATSQASESAQSEPPAAAEEPPSAYMSSAVSEEPQVETFEPAVSENHPKIAVDPLMAEGGPSNSGEGSFSEINELPPLKEVYIAPPPPPPPVEAPLATPVVSLTRSAPKKPEKPRVQPREVAAKAIKEVKGVPPKLMMYALGGAGALILAIAIGVTIYIHNQSSDDDAGATRPAAATTTEQSPAPVEPAQPVAPPVQTPVQQQEPVPTQAQPVEVPETPVPRQEPVAIARSRAPKRKAAVPVVMPGQLTVDSTPQGAQVQFDGKTDPTWITPFSWTNVQPGQHSITVSKAGYSTDTRTVEVNSGSRASASVRLSQLMATLVVKSDPPGADIYVDSRNVGTKTPAQVSVGKGPHVVLVRMPGYLDETMSAQFVLGQTFNFSPTLRALGNVDSIRTVGKMSKLFGKANGQSGQGVISIHTQPKGAQVAINQHMLDKNSPLDVMVDPGNYEIDITLSGYAPIHRVVTADRGGKAVVDEVLEPQ
jgi:eukaryotic-like serine/threonine-protein kinase